MPISIGRKIDTDDIESKLPYSKNKRISKRKSGLNSDQRQSNNFEAVESYGGMAAKKEVLRSNYGLTERMSGEEQAK